MVLFGRVSASRERGGGGMTILESGFRLLLFSLSLPSHACESHMSVQYTHGGRGRNGGCRGPLGLGRSHIRCLMQK